MKRDLKKKMVVFLLCAMLIIPLLMTMGCSSTTSKEDNSTEFHSTVLMDYEKAKVEATEVVISEETELPELKVTVKSKLNEKIKCSFE